jgi:hypothetical protein
LNSFWKQDESLGVIYRSLDDLWRDREVVQWHRLSSGSDPTKKAHTDGKVKLALTASGFGQEE